MAKKRNIVSVGEPHISARFAEKLQAQGEDLSQPAQAQDATQTTEQLGAHSQDIAPARSLEAELPKAVVQDENVELTGEQAQKLLENGSEPDPEQETVEADPEHEDADDNEQAVLSKYATKKINKLHADKSKKAEEIEALRREIDELKASRQQPLPNVSDDYFVDPFTNQRFEKPNPNNYGQNAASYIADLSSYKDARERVIHVTRAQEEKKREIEEVRREYINRANDASKTIYPDFYDAINKSNIGLLDQYHPLAVHAIQESAQGPHIAYYLARNPEFVQRLATKPTHLVLKEIGNLEGILEMSIKPKTVSKAPKPTVSPKTAVRGMTGSAPPKDHADMSIREMRDRLKQKRR